MEILTIRYKSVNCYLIDTGAGLLAFDAGWPDTYREYKDLLKSEGYKISDIKWLIVSHFHIDHAGLAGIFADKGIKFFVFKNQVYGIEEMESLISGKGMNYHKIDQEKIIISDVAESRNLLKSIGISGEVIHTNGHGEQCVTLLFDSGEAFIGDLIPETMVDENDINTVNDWKMLRMKGVFKIFPAHANEFRMLY